MKRRSSNTTGLWITSNGLPLSQGRSLNPVQILHGLAYTGHEKNTHYRDGQNVIRERTGGLSSISRQGPTLPLMRASSPGSANKPISFRFRCWPVSPTTSSPPSTYYDGNGRTARLLATVILHKYGYGMRGIYSLEESMPKTSSVLRRARRWRQWFTTMPTRATVREPI